jgi:hypothetical protein
MLRKRGVGKKMIIIEGLRRRFVLRSVGLKEGLGIIMVASVCVRMRNLRIMGPGPILAVLTIAEGRMIMGRASVRTDVLRSVPEQVGQIV